MTRAFVGVGSNINPAKNVRKAIRLLASEVNITGISTVYCTEPEGRPEQPWYYNCVVEIETKASPEELQHKVLRKIEGELGRKRSEDKYASRTIDLDLIIYDDLAVETEDFTLPDPEITDRPFLAIPLQELRPDLVLPGSGLSIKKVAEALPKDKMQPLKNYTDRLKKEIL